MILYRIQKNLERNSLPNSTNRKLKSREGVNYRDKRPYSRQTKDATASNKTLTYEQAMSGPDKSLWVRAINEELSALSKTYSFETVERPENSNILTLLWVWL